MRVPKISVIGAGNVGGSTAAAVAHRRLGAVWLYDIVEGLAEGKAMDISHAAAIARRMPPVTGTSNLDDLAGSDVIIITAGSARKEGMTRADLLNKNLAVVSGLCEQLLPACPEAKVLIISNPVDLLTGYLNSTWPDRDIIGLGCTLDAVRFQYFLARAAGVSVDHVEAMVIGSHDNNMMPLVNHARIGGAAARDVLDTQTLDQIVEDTRKAGAAIVAKLKTGGSFYAVSWCGAEIAEAILSDTHNVFPLSVQCSGQYGQKDITLALPCAVGIDGIERIVEIQLDDAERQQLDACASAMREKVAQIQPPA